MGKPRVIIADEDYSYIIPLQLRFVEDMFEQIELEIITDQDYFRQFISIPQTIDILVVSENLYTEQLMKHDSRCGFVMRESLDDTKTASRFTSIYKYTNIKEIFSVIMGKASGVTIPNNKAQKEPELIMVTSAVGGVGKTTVAMGIAATLSKHLKKVLYINVDYLQNFQTYLINNLPISDNELYMKLTGEVKNSFTLVRHLIRKEEFDYIPPFKGALLSLGLRHSLGIEIAEQALLSKDYDYVVVDADSTFDAEKMDLLSKSDKTIFVVTQADASVRAMSRFLENISIKDKEKVMFVCNQFDQTRRNALVSNEYDIGFLVNEYIEYMEDYWEQRNEKFSSNSNIQKIAMTIM